MGLFKAINRVFISLSLLLMLNDSLSAQIEVGVKGGIGLTALYFLKDSGIQYKSGISLPYMLFATWHFSPAWSVHSEIGHLLSGGRVDGLHPIENLQNPSVFADCSGELQLHYLVLSVMIRCSQPLTRKCSVYVQIGLTPQLLLTAQELKYGEGTLYTSEGRASVTNKYFEQTNNVKAAFHSWNFTASAGLGACWNSDGESVTIELITNQGIQPIEKSHGVNAHRTAFYGLMIGYGTRL